MKTILENFGLKIVPCFFLAALLVASIPWAGWAERPFKTESAEMPKFPQLRLDGGIDYSHIDGRTDFLALPSLGLNFSTGNWVELQASYDFLYRFARQGTTVYGSGDLTLWTKVRFIPEESNLPGLGVRFGVKLPNASDKEGLGTDQTDFYASVLASKRLGRFENRLNLGLAIFDDPLKLRGQHDFFTVGLAGIYNLSPKWQVLVDFYSQQGAEARFRLSRLSTGVRYLKKQWAFDAALKKGLRSDNKGFRDELSLDWGIILGVSRYFQLDKN